MVHSNYGAEGKYAEVLVPYLEWDEKGHIIKVSPSLASMCGFKIQENFINTYKNINSFFNYPKWDFFKKRLSTRKRINNFSFITKNGVGSITELLVDVLQVNSARNHEIFIKSDSDNIHTFIDDEAPIGIFISTVDGKFLEVNKKLVEMYGYSSKEDMLAIEDISQKIYWQPKDRQRLINELRKNKLVENFRYIGKKKDGSPILLQKKVIAKYEWKELSYFFGYATDITKEDENPLPCFKCDPDGNIIYAHKEMAKWLGYEIKELYEKKVKELYFDPKNAIYWSKILYKEKKLIKSPRTFRHKNADPVKVYVDVKLYERCGHPIYIWGQLNYDPSGVVILPWMNRLKEQLSEEEYEISAKYITEFSKELKITDLTDEEISQISNNIKSLKKTHESYKHSQDNNSIIKLRRYSLGEKIELELWHTLDFFRKRYELLKDAYNLRQVCNLLGVEKEKIFEMTSNKEIVSIYHGGENYFPLCQFHSFADNGIVNNLHEVLINLEISDISKLIWLDTPNEVFDSHKPIEILKSELIEDRKKVIREALSVGGSC